MWIDLSRAIGLAALFGFVVGSWLVLVVSWLPRRLAYDWKNQVRELRRAPLLASPRPRLWAPRPPCSACRSSRRGRGLPWLFMKTLWGRVGGCQACFPGNDRRIVILTMVLFAACAWRFGPTLTALCAMGLVAALLTLAWIDARTGFLPDIITLPLLWMGLLVNCGHLFTLPVLAIGGAVAGYLFLWVLHQIFLWTTGRQGMGYGDFKALAALGAWLGLHVLPWLLLLACVAAMMVGRWRIAYHHLNRDQPQPFGPYLAASGIFVLLTEHRFDGFINFYG